MCTVSIVPCDQGLRLMCNRDERDTRPRALPPHWRKLGPRLAIFPVDPQSGGTWLGANDAGLVMTVLNRSQVGGHGQPELRRSRGLIVPTLLESATLEDAVAVVHTLDVSAFEPFRLVAIQHEQVCVVTSDGRCATVDRPAFEQPLVFTSSSLGDALVEGPRGRLFERMVLRAHDSWLGGQARFHGHQWPNWPELSVRMERRDARTVSRSIVDVTAVGIDFRYEALAAIARAA